MPWSPFSPPRTQASCSAGLSSEDLADAALAAGWASPAATAAAALLAAPLSDGAHGRPSQPAVTDTGAALRARHADYTKMRAAREVLDHPRAG